MNYEKELNKILSKTRITGKDLGRAYLLDVLYNYSTNKGFLISPMKLEEIGQGLSFKEQREHLAGYKMAHSLPNIRNIANGYLQQFLKAYNQLFLPLQAVYNAEKIEASQENNPLIITEQAYKRLKKEALEEKREKVISLYEAIIYFIDNAITKLEAGKAPAIPSSILEEIEKTKGQPVKNEYILKNWKRKTASEKPISNNEKLEAVNKKGSYEKELDILRGADYIISKYNIPAELVKDIDKKYLEQIFNYILRNDSDLGEYALAYYDKAIYKLKAFLNKDSEADITKINITKYDVLKHCKSLFLIIGLIKELEGAEEVARFLYDDFEDLIYKTRNFLLYLIYPGEKGTVIDNHPFYKPLFSIGVLADLGIEAFSDMLKITNQDIINYYLNSKKYKKTQASYKGLAIITDNSDIETVKGIYNQPVEEKAFKLENLKANEDRIDYMSLTKKDKIAPSISQIYGYNTLLEIVGEYFKIDFSPIYIDINYLQGFINDSYNKLLAYYYCNVVGTAQEKQVKRDMIKELFPYIDLSIYSPKAEVVEKYRSLLKSINLQEDTSFFNNIDDIITDIAGGLE